jgi:hypothetical protein
MAINSSPPGPAQRAELNETIVTVTRQEREVVNPPPTKSEITLKQMLDKYLFTLGYENDHLLEVLLALMTRGKICVEFRAYNERLALKDPARMMTQPATIQLFNDYLTSVRANKKVSISGDRTQRITVQMPKIMGPPGGNS